MHDLENPNTLSGGPLPGGAHPGAASEPPRDRPQPPQGGAPGCGAQAPLPTHEGWHGCLSEVVDEWVRMGLSTSALAKQNITRLIFEIQSSIDPSPLYHFPYSGGHGLVPFINRQTLLEVHNSAFHDRLQNYCAPHGGWCVCLFIFIPAFHLSQNQVLEVLPSPPRSNFF